HDGVVEGTFSHDAKMAMTTPKVTVGIFMSGEMEFNLQNKVRMDALMYVLDLIYTETIREEEGGTYGVGAFGQFIPKPDNRFLFQITFDTNPEKAALLLVLAKEGFKSMAENGPTQEQLSKAKENFLKNITENRHQNSYWLTTIGDFINFGTDTDTEYENAVNSLTAEDIKDFAASILDQGNEITLTLGPEE
ncbi:MAG TPA: insulinase family protein, partial [Candidatus Coprenecus stercoripullorum]|nr:insulinase family protein [Candidatus Coprenecus stercoripullorum]